jgi:CRP-like cAMP-binding protein/predicted MFS family arabinose efflux permease
MARHARTDRPRLTAPLRHRDFRLLITSFFISFAGSWAYNVALAVYVFEQTGSAAWVGAATVGRFLPSLLFGPYGGVLAERFERVRLMAGLDWVSTALMLVLALVAALDGPALLAIVLAGLTSVNATVYEPAAAAITPETVPESDLAAANALRNMVDNIAIIAGPVLGALLLLVSPAPVVFLVNGLTFAVSGVVVSRMTVRSTPVDVTEAGTAGPLKQMLVGIRAITGSATAATLVAYSVIASFVYGVDTVQFVVLSEDRLGTGPDGFGYLLAGLGVGGIAAAGLVNRMAAWPRLGTVILLGMALYCLPTLLFLVLDDPAAAAAIQVVRGAGTLVVDVLAITALQRSLPKEVLGRVFGAFFTGVLLAISLGALVTPWVISRLGLDASLWMAGALLPALCLLGLPWLRRMDAQNVVRLAAIEPRVLVLERLGILTEASRPMLERLAAEAEDVEVPAGTVVIREGDEADAFYVLVDGEVGVRARGEGAVDQDLPPMTSGAYFGEIGLLERIPRTATVTATRPSRLLRIDGDAFVDALTNVPASTALLEGARSRLARTHPNRRPATDSAPVPAGSVPAGSVPAQSQQTLLDDRDREVTGGGEEPSGGQPPAP